MLTPTTTASQLTDNPRATVQRFSKTVNNLQKFCGSQSAVFAEAAKHVIVQQAASDLYTATKSDADGRDGQDKPLIAKPLHGVVNTLSTAPDLFAENLGRSERLICAGKGQQNSRIKLVQLRDMQRFNASQPVCKQIVNHGDDYHGGNNEPLGPYAVTLNGKLAMIPAPPAALPVPFIPTTLRKGVWVPTEEYLQ